jgi:hypothetical protein
MTGLVANHNQAEQVGTGTGLFCPREFVEEKAEDFGSRPARARQLVASD